MQQYIYGDVKKAGYVYVSSDPAFFANAKRVQRLQPLVKNVSGTHGGLAATEYQSYWMLTTDLEISGEPERLYMQACGGDENRGSYYVQGYLSDASDGDLYGPKFLDLLKTRFATQEQVMAMAEAGGLQSVSAPPMEDLMPAALDRELLQNLLVALMDKDVVHVIVRLNAVGKEAMAQARSLLLAVYKHLPYEQRRLRGFFTGATPARLSDWNNPLPGSVKLVVMDGDADVDSLYLLDSQKLFDLKSPRLRETFLPRRLDGEEPFYVTLANFLTDQDPDEREDFFRFCGSYIDRNTEVPDVRQYLTLLDIFKVGRVEVTRDQIHRWACANWNENQDRAYDRIAGAVTPERLTQHLAGEITSLDQLAAYGVVEARYGEENTDPNCALTLRMTQQLLQRYAPGAEQAMYSALCTRFGQVAVAEHPCLAEKNPTAATIAALDKLNLSPELRDTTILAEQVRQTVFEKLRALAQSIRNTYLRVYEEQYEAGLRQIGDFAFGNLPLAELYRQLGENYLFDELTNCTDRPSWNEQIARNIVACSETRPKGLSGYADLKKWLAEAEKCLLETGGKFTPEQSAVLEERKRLWDHILELGSRVCGSVDALLELFAQIDKADVESGLKLEIKTAAGAALAQKAPAAKQVFACLPQLLERSRNPKEKEILLGVIAAVPNLKEIPAGADLNRTLTQLSHIRQLASAGLTDPGVTFRDWEIQESADRIRQRLEGLRDYTGGMVPTELKSRKVRRWAYDHLQQNRALMLLLAKADRELRPLLLKDLARNPGAVSPEDIHQLYKAGVSLKELKAGAGAETSPAWTGALNAAFPELPALPEPFRLEYRQRAVMENKMILAVAIVLGVLALSLALIMGLGGASMLGLIVLTGAVAFLALAFLLVSLLVRLKQRKKLLRLLSAALLPGLVAAIVWLVLAALK